MLDEVNVAPAASEVKVRGIVVEPDTELSVPETFGLRMERAGQVADSLSVPEPGCIETVTECVIVLPAITVKLELPSPITSSAALHASTFTCHVPALSAIASVGSIVSGIFVSWTLAKPVLVNMIVYFDIAKSSPSG